MLTCAALAPASTVGAAGLPASVPAAVTVTAFTVNGWLLAVAVSVSVAVPSSAVPVTRPSTAMRCARASSTPVPAPAQLDATVTLRTVPVAVAPAPARPATSRPAMVCAFWPVSATCDTWAPPTLSRYW